MQLLKHMAKHHNDEQNQTSEKDLIVNKEKGYGEDEEIVKDSIVFFVDEK